MNDGETEALWRAWRVSWRSGDDPGGGGADPAAGPGEGPQAIRPGRGAA